MNMFFPFHLSFFFFYRRVEEKYMNIEIFDPRACRIHNRRSFKSFLYLKQNELTCSNHSKQRFYCVFAVWFRTILLSKKGAIVGKLLARGCLRKTIRFLFQRPNTNRRRPKRWFSINTAPFQAREKQSYIVVSLTATPSASTAHSNNKPDHDIEGLSQKKSISWDRWQTHWSPAANEAGELCNNYDHQPSSHQRK
jgi:hypothetical protein